MTTPPFGIAGIQLDLPIGDNVEAIVTAAGYAKLRFPWLQMILFSELAAFGPATKHAQTLPGPAEDRFCQAAADLGVWLIPGTLFEKTAEGIYNTASVIDPTGKVVGRYRKMYPWLPYERGVLPGKEGFVFEVPDVGKFGLSICYDMWFPETVRSLVWQGAEVILHPTYTSTIDRDLELSIARSMAGVNQCVFFDINGTGALGFGRSIVVNADGDVLHQAGTSGEVIPLEIDFDAIRRSRQRGLKSLGQPLKQFRDTAHLFPQYQPDAQSASLDSLGPLRIPPHSPQNPQTS